MTFRPLPSQISSLAATLDSQQYPWTVGKMPVQVVGGKMVEHIELSDIARMRALTVDALATGRPTIFVWDLQEATRAASPEVRLASLVLRRDLLSELERIELATFMIAPKLFATQILLRIILQGMPRRNFVHVVDGLPEAQTRIEALLSEHHEIPRALEEGYSQRSQ